jgi:hypothetical protein
VSPLQPTNTAAAMKIGTERRKEVIMATSLAVDLGVPQAPASHPLDEPRRSYLNRNHPIRPLKTFRGAPLRRYLYLLITRRRMRGTVVYPYTHAGPGSFDDSRAISPSLDIRPPILSFACVPVAAYTHPSQGDGIPPRTAALRG